MEEIRKNVTKQSRRNAVSRLIHARNDKETIAAWKSDLGGILQVFIVRPGVLTWLSLTTPIQAELALNTHVAVSDVHHNVLEIRSDVSKIRGEISGQVCPVSTNSLSIRR